MEDQRGYWGVIPGEVFHDQELTAAAKLLYLVLSSMAHKDGYCWPSNETLAAEMDLSKRRVQELLSKLQKRGYIRVEIQRNGGTQEVERRNIYCGLFVGREAPSPSCEKSPDPPAKSLTPSCEKSPDPPAKSRSCLIGGKDESEKPPIVPQETDAQTLFDRFWAAYPKKKGKEAARRAWRKLTPDMNLCRVMAEALDRQKRSEDWRKDAGKYIPYPASWLNGRRWEDEPDELPPSGTEGEEGVTYI